MNPTDLRNALAMGDKKAIEPLVDAFFAGLKTKFSNPIAVMVLDVANAAVDGVLQHYGL